METITAGRFILLCIPAHHRHRGAQRSQVCIRWKYKEEEEETSNNNTSLHAADWHTEVFCAARFFLQTPREDTSF